MSQWVMEYVYQPTGADGREAQVWSLSMPARFFEIRLPATHDGNGEEDKKAHTISTGSGKAMRDLAHRIAREFANGMLGIDD